MKLFTDYFNILRYKKLIELEKTGKISFFDEQFNELLTYRSNVEKQIDYNRKTDYFLLIQKYVNGIITPWEFRSKFLLLEKQNSKEATILLKNFQKLEGFTFSEDIDKFSDLLNLISDLCLGYDVSWDETTEPMSEDEFYSLIKPVYYEMQKNFPFENFNNQTYKQLVSRSFKCLMLTLGLEILLILMNIHPIH